MTAAPWMVGVPWDPDSPAETSSRRLAELAAQRDKERQREDRMAGLKNQALLRRHVMLQERAILLEMGWDPATLPPIPSLEDIELEKPEALSIPQEKIADLVYHLQDVEDGAKRHAQDREPVPLPDATPPPPPTGTARSATPLGARIRGFLSRAARAATSPPVELEQQPREAIR